jgi:hypothetical protein
LLARRHDSARHPLRSHASAIRPGRNRRSSVAPAARNGGILPTSHAGEQVPESALCSHWGNEFRRNCSNKEPCQSTRTGRDIRCVDGIIRVTRDNRNPRTCYRPTLFGGVSLSISEASPPSLKLSGPKLLRSMGEVGRVFTENRPNWLGSVLTDEGEVGDLRAAPGGRNSSWRAVPWRWMK